MPDGKMFDELISDWAVDKLAEDHEKPFFLAVGFVRPHVPYTAPKEFFDLYDLDNIQVPSFPNNEMADIPIMGKSVAYGTIKTGDYYAVVNLSDSYWRELVYGYLACVSFVDHELGKVLKALEDSRYADNTIVVLWSDHGQHLDEKKTLAQTSPVGGVDENTVLYKSSRGKGCQSDDQSSGQPAGYLSHFS